MGKKTELRHNIGNPKLGGKAGKEFLWEIRNVGKMPTYIGTFGKPHACPEQHACAKKI